MRDDRIPEELENLSERALCVRYGTHQERMIELMAHKYGVSQARIARYLVARGINQHEKERGGRY